jgi:hypothetical protein
MFHLKNKYSINDDENDDWHSVESEYSSNDDWHSVESEYSSDDLIVCL